MPEDHSFIGLEDLVPLVPERAIVARYVELLTGAVDTPLCWRFLPDSAAEKARVASYETKHRQEHAKAGAKWCLRRNFDGSLDDVWDDLIAHQGQGWGIFAVVNAGGRNAKAIKTVRAIYIDHDNMALSDVKWHVEPSFVVQRDATHWHAYWLVDDCPEEEFSLAQHRLIQHYGSDTKVHDLPRVLRIPGTVHLKGQQNPRAVTLIEMHGATKRPVAQLVAGLPELDPDFSAKVRQRHASTMAEDAYDVPDGVEIDAPWMIERARQEIARAVQAGRVSHDGVDGDYALFAIAIWLKEFGLKLETATDFLWERFNPACVPPWETADDPTFLCPIHRVYGDKDFVFGRRYEQKPHTAEEAFGESDAFKNAQQEAEDIDLDDVMGDAKEEWGEPLPVFDEEDGEDLAFPDGALPAILEDFARDEAQRKGVDIGTVVLPVLIACAAAIHHGDFQIQPTNDSTWRQRPVLWGVISGGPSSIKTPVMAAAMAPLEDIQKRWFRQDMGLHAQHKRAVEEWEAERRSHLINIKNSTKTIAAHDGTSDDPAPTELPKRRLLVKNATVEALANLLASNGQRGVLVYRNELAAWITGFDIYREGNSGHDRTHFLEGWDCAPQIIDRVSKKDVVQIDNWYINMLGSIQPERLKPLAKYLSMDGLLQRFLPVVAGTPGIGADREPSMAVGAYYSLVRRLTEMRAVPEAGKGIVPVRLSPEAREYWRRVDQFRRDEMTLYSGHEAYCEHLGKWPNQFARLLLVLHAVESVAAMPPDPLAVPKLPSIISGATAERAARLATHFFIPNARRFYKSIFSPSTQWTDTEWIASFILTRGPEIAVIHERDIYNNHHQLIGKDKTRDRQEAVLPLEHRGWLRPTKYKAGRGDVEWAVNPLVHVRFATRAEAERQRKDALKAKYEEAVRRRRAEKAGEL